LEEVGASTAREHPKSINPDLLARMDAAVTLGADAHVEHLDEHCSSGG
jgi:hypothetical protein